MALVKQPLLNLVKLNSFDVHPVLYYVLLKFFLNVTTFYTNSIFIKIIFARLFSLIVFIIGFYWLNRIFNNSRSKSLLFFILLLSFPSVLHFSTLIRMYSLAGMFLSLEVYNLYKFLNTSNSSQYTFILCSLLFGVLAAYTDYFSAVSAGMLLLISFILTFLKRRKNKGVCLFISGIILGILYVPQVFLSTIKLNSNNQYHDSFKYSVILIHFIFNSFKQPLVTVTGLHESSLMTNNNILRCGLCVLISSLLVYCLFKLFVNCNDVKITVLMLVTILTFLFTCIIGVISSLLIHEFAIRIMYPIFIINICLILNIIVNYGKVSHFMIVVNMLFCIILITSFSFSTYYSVINCYHSVNVFRNVKRYDHKSVFVKNKVSKLSTFPHYQALFSHGHQFTLVNKATYYLYEDKQVKTNKLYSKKTSPIQPIGYKIVNKVWPNIVKK